MNKKILKTICLMLILAMAFNIAGCSAVEEFFDLGKSHRRERNRDDDDDDPEETEETEETEPDETEPDDPQPTVADVSDELTYPDHIASYAEIHPSHAAGTVSGEDAVEILNDLESQVLVDGIGSSYVNAEIYFDDYESIGIHFDDDDIGWGPVMTDHDQDVADVEEALEQLYSIDRESLDIDDRIFYDKFLYDMELTAYALQYTAFDYYESALKPLTGPQSEVLFILEVLDFETVEDAENYILVLRDTDRFYDELCEFEEERADYGFVNSDDVYEEVAESFDNLAAQSDDCFLDESFRDRLDNIDGLTDQQREALIEEHDQVMQDIVFPEFEECAERMRALECGAPSVGVSSYPGGDAYYAYIFATQTNSGRTIEASIQQLEDYTDSIMNTMTSVASSPDTSWVDEYLDHDYSIGDTQDNLDYLYDIVQDDFPAIPDHAYRLMSVPEVFEDDFSPAAFLGYHLDTFDSNIIITNEGSISDTFGITCAHEGYPGHMYESLYHRSSTSHPYMYICDSIGYAEGWASYVENYSFKYFSITPASEVVRVENQLNSVLFARFDLGINYEGWTAQDCADWYGDLVGMSVSADMIMDAYNLLLSDPGYGIKYGLGMINTGMVMAQLHNDFPNATDMEIHTAYLNAMSGTFEQILEYAEYFLDEEYLTTPVANWGDVYTGSGNVSSGTAQDDDDDEPDETEETSGGSLLGN